MKPSSLAVAFLLPLVVSACGIPDIVAHGVKEIDKAQAKSQQPVARAPAPTPAPAVTPEEAPEPTYTGASGPARPTVKVEELR